MAPVVIGYIKRLFIDKFLLPEPPQTLYSPGVSVIQVSQSGVVDLWSGQVGPVPLSYHLPRGGTSDGVDGRTVDRGASIDRREP